MGDYLSAFSLLYGFGVKIRSNLYRNGVLKSTRLGVPVISIGNITVGGAGKTPLSILIASKLKTMNAHPVILSRGYKRKSKDDIVVVSDRDSILKDAEAAGDEPFMMAERLPGIPVVVGPDRIKTGTYAINRLNAGCLVLDDGFQHIRLLRDLDIVVIDASRSIERERLLPGGRLREPFSGLRRADVIALSHSAGADALEDNLRFLSDFHPGTPLILGNHRPCQIVVRGEPPREPRAIRGKKVFAFCGIAKPDNFISSLNSLGCKVLGTRFFRDHHSFQSKEIERMDARADSLGCDVMVTTEKDSVKLSAITTKTPLCTLIIRFELSQGEGILDEMLRTLFPLDRCAENQHPGRI